MENTKVVSKLNEVLRGERAAAESYVNVLGKIGDDPNSDHVREIKSKHLSAVQELSSAIKTLGGEPVQSSGMWGSFASAFTNASNVLGDKAAVAALKEGEEHGLKLYKELLDECGDHSVARNLAQEHIAKQQEYISFVSKIEEQI